MSQIEENMQIDEILARKYEFRLPSLHVLADGRKARLVGGAVERPLDSRRWCYWYAEVGTPGWEVWEFGRVIGLCQESSPSNPQIGVIMGGQPHAEQLFTVPLLRVRFRKLIVHTIRYCSKCFLPARGRTHTYARGANMLNVSPKASIYSRSLSNSASRIRQTQDLARCEKYGITPRRRWETKSFGRRDVGARTPLNERSWFVWNVIMSCPVNVDFVLYM